MPVIKTAQLFSCLIWAVFASLPAVATTTENTANSDTNLKSSARPNVVIIMVDDAGLMDFEPFGGEAKMPNIQNLADQGVRFTNYRTSPLCAPSRAMMLTGIDNHLTGIATIPEVLPRAHEDAPGYSMALEPGVKTIADRLRNVGYRTYMTGKWHMGSRTVAELPVSHGFDRSFILDASGADNWEQKPYMPYYLSAPWFEDDKPATLPEDFYSSKFIVDKMIDYIGEDRTSTRADKTTEAEQPFLAYLAFQAIHIPVQAPPEFTQNYAGVFDDGWHALRLQRWQKAQVLGLIPKDAPLTDMPEGLRDWQALTDEERRYYSKTMMVNAGMLEAMDHHIGRLMSWLESRGELDNTLFVVTSDNGPEHNDISRRPGIGLWYATQNYHRDIATMGEKGSLVSIGPEWAAAAAAPSKLFKFYSSDGGIRVPLIFSGPNVPAATTQSSFGMVTDILPTVMDLLNLPIDSSSLDRQPLENAPEAVALTGRSLGPVIRGNSTATYGPEDVMAIETAGNVALFKGAYKLARNLPPHGDRIWRLYNIEIDPGETQDLAATEPELLRDMKAEYQNYAKTYGVQEVPEGYNSITQLNINTASKYLKNYGLGFGIAGAGLVFLILLVARKLLYKLLGKR
ncbi:arylsulfatase [Porticoccaceae bacterium]|nr:arylsulfatase [Porticoccaceae bacterium]